MDVSIMLGLSCLMAVWICIRCYGDSYQTNSIGFLAFGFGGFAYWWLNRDVNWLPVYSSAMLMVGMFFYIEMIYRRKQ